MLNLRNFIEFISFGKSITDTSSEGKHIKKYNSVYHTIDGDNEMNMWFDCNGMKSKMKLNRIQKSKKIQKKYSISTH